MTSYTYLLRLPEIEKIKEFYSDSVCESKNQYALFEIRVPDCVITVFKTHKVLLMGSDVVKYVGEINQLLGICEYEAIGSDEVGTGDVFGPVIVCSVYTSLEAISLLTRLGVKDSKKFTDAEIMSIVPKFKEYVTYSLLVLNNKKYNEIYQKGYNLNKIKAVLHNSAINNTLTKINNKKVPIILDDFCGEDKFYEYIKHEQNKVTDITFKTQGESYHIAVAAASMLARFAFIQKFNEICREIGFKVNKGAGPLVDEDLKKLASLKGVNQLKNYCKMNFRNVKDIVDGK